MAGTVRGGFRSGGQRLGAATAVHARLPRHGPLDAGARRGGRGVGHRIQYRAPAGTHPAGGNRRGPVSRRDGILRTQTVPVSWRVDRLAVQRIGRPDCLDGASTTQHGCESAGQQLWRTVITAAAGPAQSAAGRHRSRHIGSAVRTLVGYPEHPLLSMSSAVPSTIDLAGIVCDWQRQHGRHHLPWQGTRDPYRIWRSEIMLQQTQVSTVIPYYERFLARFPDIASLAAADQEAVMPYWAGLGYYARARNLHRCAQVLVSEHGGRFPASSVEIAELPGIGRSTAAAIAAFAYGERSPIMDGNVKRVFTRYFGVRGHPGLRAVEQRLWELAEQALSDARGDIDMS